MPRFVIISTHYDTSENNIDINMKIGNESDGKNDYSGCLIVALLVLGAVWLLFTCVLANANPRVETLMMIIASVVVAVIGYLVAHIG